MWTSGCAWWLRKWPHICPLLFLAISSWQMCLNWQLFNRAVKNKDKRRTPRCSCCLLSLSVTGCSSNNCGAGGLSGKASAIFPGKMLLISQYRTFVFTGPTLFFFNQLQSWFCLFSVSSEGRTCLANDIHATTGMLMRTFWALSDRNYSTNDNHPF